MTEQATPRKPLKRSDGNCFRGGSWSGAHVPLPAAPVVHQRPHITQLAHAADRAPTVVLSSEAAVVPERVANVYRLHRAGYNALTIAKNTGIDVRTVRTWLKEAGLIKARGEAAPPGIASGRPRSLTQESIDEIVAAYTPGASMTVMSRELGVARATILKYLEAAGVEVVKAKHSPKRRPVITSSDPKKCPACGEMFQRHVGERNTDWKLRKCCDRTCSSALARAAFARKKGAA